MVVSILHCLTPKFLWLCVPSYIPCGHILKGLLTGSDLMNKIKDIWSKDLVLQQIIEQLQQSAHTHPKYTWFCGQLRRKGRLVVGNDVPLREDIISLMHDSCKSSLGHHCYHTDCVRRCDTCQKNKYEIVASPSLL
ncbi:hypothetical protein Ancab_040176 [Ancistrocladus abbreviatus]